MLHASSLNINRISGTGTDPDGYLSSKLGDHPPIPLIDFDLNRFFPVEAKSASITRKTVVLHMQIDEDGSIKSAKISSPPSGYKFDEAVMKFYCKGIQYEIWNYIIIDTTIPGRHSGNNTCPGSSENNP